MLSAPLSLPRASPSLIKPHVIHLTWPGRAAALINSDTYTHTRVYKSLCMSTRVFLTSKRRRELKFWFSSSRGFNYNENIVSSSYSVKSCTPEHSLGSSKALISQAKMIYLRGSATGPAELSSVLPDQ
jgi:hypothetical protein